MKNKKESTCKNIINDLPFKIKNEGGQCSGYQLEDGAYCGGDFDDKYEFRDYLFVPFQEYKLKYKQMFGTDVDTNDFGFCIYYGPCLEYHKQDDSVIVLPTCMGTVGPPTTNIIHATDAVKTTNQVIINYYYGIFIRDYYYCSWGNDTIADSMTDKEIINDVVKNHMDELSKYSYQVTFDINDDGSYRFNKLIRAK